MMRRERTRTSSESVMVLSGIRGGTYSGSQKVEALEALWDVERGEEITRRLNKIDLLNVIDFLKDYIDIEEIREKPNKWFDEL